jgi:putative selenate reductase
MPHPLTDPTGAREPMRSGKIQTRALRVAELAPAPFPSLLRRLVVELEREGKVFDLPARRFWRGSPDLDTSVVFHGHRASNPAGPAAGPHGQMAQNIALSWLAGGRILELKTVQVEDRLKIPRPCIDMTNVGYNVEWSQELRLEDSLHEYVAGSMLIDVLRQLVPGGKSKPDTILDMSVGYDLAGIRSPKVRSWIASMKDARKEVEALRREIPDELERFRDLDFGTTLSDQVTLSTFHGCPAAEIEAIAGFLLEELELNVTVKLNPTLLGREAVDGLLHDRLGYVEMETRAEDFARDLQWEQALEVTDRLTERARVLGRVFRVKLSNTLVVRNHRRFFPASEEVMYLSGAPLHVLTLSLVERFRRARPELPLSFSAGVDARNFPDCVALGLTPVTVCTDLLRPGGYARLPRYLENLEERMRGLGVSCLGDYVVRAAGQGEEAIRAVVPPSPLQGALLEGLAGQAIDLRPILARAGREDLYDPLVERAAVLNTPVLVAQAVADPRYGAEQNRGGPRKIGSRLALFDCINCDKCVPVCPNDANFVYETHAWEGEYGNYRVQEGRPVAVAGGRFAVREEHQIASFQDFCNDCGNCDVFCPEDGGPYLEKPRFFGSLEAWQRGRGRDGFFARRDAGVDLAWGRIGGVEYRLEIDRTRDRALFSDGDFTVELRHRERRPVGVGLRDGAAEGRTLDLAAYLAMAVLLDGVLDPRRANPVNAMSLPP